MRVASVMVSTSPSAPYVVIRLFPVVVVRLVSRPTTSYPHETAVSLGSVCVAGRPAPL